MLAGLRRKLPSRNTALFWGGVLGLVGFYKYNKNESRKRLEYYCSRAEHVANETIGALDTPRKVHVFVATPMGELGTRKARLHWEKYILPVFVAGALDYELTLVNDTQMIDGLEKLIDERVKENDVRELKNKNGSTPGQVDVSMWKPEPYPGIMDIVAIGRETWVEVINGINDGATGSLDRKIPPLPAANADEKAAGANTPAAIPTAPVQVIDYDRFDDNKQQPELPGVAYISHFNLTGWGSVPLKIWNFFHDQQNVDLYASQALQVVFESTRRRATGAAEIVDMGKDEEELPSWEGEHMEIVVGQDVADALQIYDTQNDTAPHRDEAAPEEQ
ncbi:hypothetical protein GQ54DRAFT_259275 [Martensiomyces pterosporus]|nr:hypothetical protein GQ54DRAFT_259275 [Martensiomyces pterosporus]